MKGHFVEARQALLVWLLVLAAMTAAPGSWRRRESGTWLTVAEVAELLGVTTATVYRLVNDGTLPASRINGTKSIRVARVDVDRLLKRVPAPPAPGR
jgi:excisionase family DNA binding protein